MTQQYTTLSEIPLSKSSVEHASFSYWYKLFQKHIPTSRIISPLPDEFIQYLEQDGIKLPVEKNSSSYYTDKIQRNEDNEYSDWDNSDDEENTRKYKQPIDPLTHFPELHQRIKDIIDEIGPVTPKLNWSAPRDATWILPNNNMKCNEVNEIYLLLNASNYIAYDLEHAFDDCIDKDQITPTKPSYELVLRQWFNINPALEFRIFVKNQRVIGVSQRDLNYYDYLEALSDTFKDTIDEFIEDEVILLYPEQDFVIDLYIPRPFKKAFIIDINTFSRSTDPLMFSWNELVTMDLDIDNERDYELRLVKRNNVARFASKEHSENQVPKDVVDASLDPNVIKELASKWKELLSQQEADTDSDSDSAEE
ncbi:hypothetical protein TBLA_0F02200 [Henningerozyma blattae CBS 6284]|uniref:Translation initiation factor eIF2 assembly protein n=1 Tax=Henningerozyma blattae (strain ATCC 34711 / CBS 6284 / DSM 70876 / NBRC 10599 / NRRL Y-10934 / UCD 77-7) TaxID=1071380 RepID=I2H5W0_HENB6|nr:hypothetical protein TBLA_0F02200 [Tetrapisispora blattae CBS 6284]CCH61762.1 hypothetical protein TBLA_0F02200 [Tetrapisispora blattae CBS 6284]